MISRGRGEERARRRPFDVKHWGSSSDERQARFPCDDLGFAHDETFHRAVDVAAPPALVFRWLAQLRVAPYSYDWLDNFGRRSPPELVAGIDQLAPGQRVMTIFRIVAFTPDKDLTIALASRAGRALMGDFAGTYRVEARRNGETRLVARILVAYPRGWYGRVLRTLVPYADFIMFRKQLLTLRRYAERDARRATTAYE